MNINLGIMQGRLTPPEIGIQDEFYVAVELLKESGYLLQAVKDIRRRQN
mgnify:CR=1 FL=1